MNKNKGFTLIELLVVIAIIGILASVVLASLSSARDKGKDASVKSQLASMKAQAELYFATGETYEGVCAADQSANGFGNTTGPGLFRAAHDSSGSATTGDTGLAIDNASGTANDGLESRCNDTDAGWAVVVPLSNSADGAGLVKAYCSDNSGLSKEVTSNLAGGSVVCPN